MNWSGVNVLVTGAGGFIGSHLAERLVEAGANVHAAVHYNSAGSFGWLDSSPYSSEMLMYPGDVTDRDSMTLALRGIDTVFHLAALIAIPYSYAAPLSYLRVNVEGTLNVLEAARRQGVRRIVHTSTSEVYGSAQYVPIDERHQLQGQSPYSASKIGADKVAEAQYYSFDLPVVIVRPFNTFGPRQSARAVIPAIVTQLLASGEIKLGNLAAKRDLNYVSNTVDGFLLAAVTDAAVGQTLNLGSGAEISIGDLAARIGRIAKLPITIESDLSRTRPKNSEVDRLLADNSKARELLGWEPVVGLDDGLARTIDWIRANMERYRPARYVV